MKLTVADRVFEVRECDSPEDYNQCVELQKTIWHFEDKDVTPNLIFVVTQVTGGQTLGIFDESNQIAAFSHMFAKIAGPAHEYHSHMAGVLPQYQNYGLGYILKTHQRERALREGVARIVWTFDPLQSRNAYFNLVKLGGIARQYIVDFYGHSTSSLHAGLATDRLYLEWFVASRRVENCLANKSPKISQPAATIEIPANVQQLKEEDLAGVCELQLRIRRQFIQLFKQGLCCVGLRRIEGSDYSEYLFVEDWQGES